ncbi:hypothetical protein A1354_11230 [Pseudomonas asplenii]|nr:DUF2971 domain-containing protein [Pseudomonas asplenii]PNG41278.1 hypothetical protein A1354_11230 [Pseudomonas asplenii]
MPNLYKFLGENVADVLLNSNDDFGIKFSHLSDYNDPYEFFLTIDYSVPADMLATYKEAIGMVVKAPATCFAKSPAILPMWAHYAGNSNGFALEIDEGKLCEHLDAFAEEEYGFGDIDYQNEPHSNMTNLLAMAARRCKPRDMYFLYTAIRSAAYYTKTSDWSYERERRMIIGEEHLKNIAGNLILFAPKDCIKSVIVGQKARPELKEKIRTITSKIECRFLEIVIGQSSPNPYFKSEKGETLIFDGSEISKTPNFCEDCKEPTVSEGKCSWCSITRDHEVGASSRNAFRIFHSHGILDDYLAGMDAVRLKK